MPFLPLVGARFYAIEFGLPLFTAQLQQQVPNLMFRVEDVSITSLWLTVGGMLGFFPYVSERIFWHGYDRLASRGMAVLLNFGCSYGDVWLPFVLLCPAGAGLQSPRWDSSPGRPDFWVGA